MSEMVTEGTAGARMPLKQLWLSFEGRASRYDFWVRYVLAIFGGGVAVGILGAILGDTIGSVLIGLFSLLSIWPALAVQVKRWHDRDKSGWWILINLVPVIGALWALIECGFLRGTVGQNRFGSDPVV
jgi:uncharacterized membrane protein YhaH (DUF805 family)